MKRKVTLKQAEQILPFSIPFTTGTLSADWELIGEAHRYIVRSYGVEIADATENAIHPKAYDYSVTTSKHANIVKRAWGLF